MVVTERAYDGVEQQSELESAFWQYNVFVANAAYSYTSNAYYRVITSVINKQLFLVELVRWHPTVREMTISMYICIYFIKSVLLPFVCSVLI